MDMNRKNWLHWGLIVLVVIIVAAAGWYWYQAGREKVTEISPGVTLTKAAPGNMIAGLPEGLIQEKDVTPTESYRIDYTNSNTKQPVVEYLSAQSVLDNLRVFRLYFAKNGWDIVQPGKGSENPTFIFANRVNEQAIISLQVLPSGQTEVGITYLVNTQ